MQVSKWGNSLAIRIPAQVAEALNLKEGDEIAVCVAGERVFEVERDESRERMIDRLRALARPLPAGWRFNRDEANERG
jgi:antitoxin MazE